MDLVVRECGAPTPARQPVEVVERKGVGHPDTICDGLAEEISQALCRHGLERFGRILHHNVDKILLAAGSASPALGGGHIDEPLEIYVAGRATGRVGDEEVPVSAIADEACRAWIGRNLRHLDADRHVRVHPRLRPGSSALTSIFGRGRALANDTSCGIGAAPRTVLERIVLAADRALAAPEARRAHPALGEDVKIMAARVGERVTLTVSCAVIDRHVSSPADYGEVVSAIDAIVRGAAERLWSGPVDVTVNAADDRAGGDLYLTVTGTSAESGDDGEAGRGNRPTGLITPYRNTSSEAVAGKNPVTHVGKLYDLAAGRVATALVEEEAAIAGASCALVSRIGHPIDDPPLADVSLTLGAGTIDDRMRGRVRAIVFDTLARLDVIRDEILAGRVTLY